MLNGNEQSFCQAVAAPVRTLYVQTVTIYSAQPDFHNEISHCSCLAMPRPYNSFLCQMKEDELNFVTMKIILYKLFNFSGKTTALSGFRFIGSHCTYETCNTIEYRKNMRTLHFFCLRNVDNFETPKPILVFRIENLFETTFNFSMEICEPIRIGLYMCQF